MQEGFPFSPSKNGGGDYPTAFLQSPGKNTNGKTMFQLDLGGGGRHDRPLNVLCLGAHSDDIEIGCGGTLLKLAADRRDINVRWFVFGATGEREREAIESASLFLEGVKEKKVEVRQFRDSFFPYEGLHIKEVFEEIKRDFKPDLIFTHYRHDLHQDHRVISDFTWNTFRDHFILEYEIPKYDGDLGSPNVFVLLDDTMAARKVQVIMSAFQSQRKKHWFTEDTFLSILRIRGMESGSSGKYAEGYYCRKAVVSFSFPPSAT